MIQLIYEVDFCVLTISFIFLLTSPKGNREYGGEWVKVIKSVESYKLLRK